MGEGGRVDEVRCDAVVAISYRQYMHSMCDGDGKAETHKTSTPFNCSLVNARYMPILPSILGKKKLPPTSGKNPIVVSGMANTVFSVAILKGACRDKPTPPPMVMPSMYAIYGFLYVAIK